MKIGEFAQAAGIPISVLRYYDKEGLLFPVYIDSFTGYRHYSADQIDSVRRITLLKQAGCSLKEIREIMERPDSAEFAGKVLGRHEKECRAMLANLMEAKKVMMENKEKQLDILQDANGVTEETEGAEILLKSAPLPLPLNPSDYSAACRLLEEEIGKRDYQRVSGFMTLGDEDGGVIYAAVRAVRLSGKIAYLNEDINLPFEDDQRVIGKWRVLREYAVKEDFYSQQSEGKESDCGGRERVIYFLPDGERYWIYSWTKGYLILNGGDQQCLCRYEVEEYNGKHYLFVENKGYDFRRGGKPTVLVLEQIDGKRYTEREIAREDDLNMPFVPDERVLGKWKAYDFIRSKEEFEVGKKHLPGELFYKRMCFEEGGVFTSQYGEKIIGPDVQSWTKGYVLRAYNHTACAYEIVTVDGTDYMFIEWKSGDYRWGGYDTDYYVFVREE